MGNAVFGPVWDATVTVAEDVCAVFGSVVSLQVGMRTDSRGQRVGEVEVTVTAELLPRCLSTGLTAELVLPGVESWSVGAVTSDEGPAFVLASGHLVDPDAGPAGLGDVLVRVHAFVPAGDPLLKRCRTQPRRPVSA